MILLNVKLRFSQSIEKVNVFNLLICHSNLKGENKIKPFSFEMAKYPNFNQMKIFLIN